MTAKEKIEAIFDDIYMRYGNHLWIDWLKDVHRILKKHLQEPTEEIKYEWDYKKSMWIVD